MKRKATWYFKLIALGVSVALVQTSDLKAGNIAPEVTSSEGDVVLSSDGGTALFTATGGSSETPPDDRGCPPWERTGNKKYTWYIESVEGDLPLTSPGSESETDSDTLTVTIDPEKYFQIKVKVSLREEWQDSSDVPVTLYWPE